MELCFGCGEDNPSGLHLHFEEQPDGSVHATIELTDLYSGEPGIVHGGIQATILDEVMGRSVQHAIRARLGELQTSVTASLELRYRLACPVNTSIRAEGWVTGIEWPSLHVDGRLVDPAGQVVTEATARWRVLESTSPAASG